VAATPFGSISSYTDEETEAQEEKCGVYDIRGDEQCYSLDFECLHGLCVYGVVPS
jgi:hypothetical protein